MEKTDVVKYILRNAHSNFIGNAEGYAWAPANVALCKYWGKRDVELNLPVTSSLSVTLGKKGAFTKIAQQEICDCFKLNGEEIPLTSTFSLRLQKFLNLFREKHVHFLVETETTVPIATGFASSASGFAALVLALNNLYNWNLSKRELSILARLGSGSACRSLWNGFVEWQAGMMEDGMDSHGMPLNLIWPELRLGALCLTTAPKAMSSTEAMQITVATSALYRAWPEKVQSDLWLLKDALTNRDFELLGKTAEANALAMHAIMADASPPIIYSLPETIAAMQKVWQLRQAGIPVFFTQDAGANLQLLFLARDQATIVSAFPTVEVIAPFADTNAEEIILVNENDVAIGTADKMLVHVQGKLHRAFSIFILRHHQGRIELLMQQRNLAKYHSGGLWANTCCGHPRPNESIIVAAQRRLHEEMGIKTELKIIGNFCYRAALNTNLIEHEFDHILTGEMSDQIITPNYDEIHGYQWLDLEFLQRDLQANSDKYCVWLQPALKIVVAHL